METFVTAAGGSVAIVVVIEGESVVGLGFCRLGRGECGGEVADIGIV